MQAAQPELWATLDWHGKTLRINFAAGVAIAIPLQPGGPQPAFFAPSPMSATALQLDGFTGDVQRGGSCNVQVLTWAPHCHGTHTECAGHVLAESVNVLDTIDSEPCLARLVSIACPPGTSRINLQQLHKALPVGFVDYAALVLRTLPNSVAKKSRDYAAEPAYPVLDGECMQSLAASGLRHLLLDTPSLDAADNTELANHRRWWGLNDKNENCSAVARTRSLTEMIYVPDELADGDYWLDLQLSPLQADATPSRPVLYPVEYSSQ
jgi:kynurenine formamidase